MNTSPVTQKLLSILHTRQGEWVKTTELAQALYGSYDYGMSRRIASLVYLYNKDKTTPDRIHSYKAPRPYQGNSYAFPSEEPPELKLEELPPSHKVVHWLSLYPGQYVYVSALAVAVYGRNTANTRACLRNVVRSYNNCGKNPRIVVRRLGSRVITGYKIGNKHA